MTIRNPADSMELKEDPRVGSFIEVRFSYQLTYTEDVGMLELEGLLWYLDKDLKKNVTETAKKIKLTPAAVREISTAIMQDSMLESIELARKLNLPVPIQLPVVKGEPKQVEFLKPKAEKEETEKPKPKKAEKKA